MSIERALIRKLLADTRIEYFGINPTFRKEIKDRPEAAEILVEMMTSEAPEIAARAGEMLSLFGRPGLKPVAKRLSEQNTAQRIALMCVAWAIVLNSEKTDYQEMLQSVSSDLVQLLGDRSSIPQEPYEDDVEIEYEYRICDEAYLLIEYLMDPDHDEDLFRLWTNEERDAAISLLKWRLRPAIV